MTRHLTTAAKLVFALLITQIAGALGSLVTIPAIDTWYATLEKPALTPPSWVFGPVWLTLYALMGIAFFFVWTQDTRRKAVQQALSLFSLQLIANAIWSVLFFGLKSPACALADIVLLLLLIVATIAAFWQVYRPAAYLLVPYALWVSFATYLNSAIVLLNR